MYWQYIIMFWGTQYAINLKILVDIGANITNTTNIADINRYLYYKSLADTNTEILNHTEYIVYKGFQHEFQNTLFVVLYPK